MQVPEMGQQVYFFGDRKAQGNREMKNLLGGKGANLAEMTNLGLPVPPGFTITTEICTYYYKNQESYPEGFESEVESALKQIEKLVGAQFGDVGNPLLVSVRSGARVSMPGMMDTILNLGLNDETVQGLITQSKDERFAYDAYRRFVQMYADVVLGISPHHFEQALEQLKRKASVANDNEVPAADLKALVAEFKKIVLSETGKPFPTSPKEQLWGAIGAVFGSWMAARAVSYRRINKIPEDWGTAVNVQAMVFGNMGDDCATGVAFTRDPSTGERRFFGEYLQNAQGEDVVAGIRTPCPINKESMTHENLPTMEDKFPATYKELVKLYQILEKHYKDMQDIEFTVQRGKLYLLQTRGGKRTPSAAVRIAVDMVNEGLIDQRTAVSRVNPAQIEQLLHPRLDPRVVKKVIAKGLPASPGAASGEVVFSSEEAEVAKKAGKKVLLVRHETSPEDIGGMDASEGILTALGGMTCVAGETRVLTDQGFFSAEEVFHEIEKGKNFRILSFDVRTLKPVWRDIIATGSRPASAISVSVSQTGRVEENILRLTADHKMYTLDRRHLVKKPLEQLLESDDFVTVVGQVPSLGETPTNPALAYVAGAILSDGYINLQATKGSVTFIQKPTPEKADFITAVEKSFHEAFGVPFTYLRERTTVGELKGCYRRDPAERLAKIRDDLTGWILTLDKTALLSFLAGYVDGDGTYAEESSAVRLQISVSGKRNKMIEGLVLACLRVGIVPQITSNRENINLQIAEGVESILAFTHRVRPEIPGRYYESRCLALKGICDDIVDHVNFMGRIREGLKRNLMFGVEKLRRDILPLCPGESQREMQALLDSPLRSFRVKQTGDSQECTVYNFEVDATDELDKNFIVFSSRLTPVLVSNSHAAVVARGMGKPCVAGCGSISIEYKNQLFRVGDVVVKRGDLLTIDGASGEVILGHVPTINSQVDQYFTELMKWVDGFRVLQIRANAETPHDVKVARGFGAEGVGLCRTEHMFFEESRITAVREMILSDSRTQRESALAKIYPVQKEDFIAIFREMKGLPVTIRLLDPPLHEFLPKTDTEMDLLARTLHTSKETIQAKVKSLHEFNPMLGHRGCRLGISFPEIYEMQVRAIMDAACFLVMQEDFRIDPEIMVPFIGGVEEFRFLKTAIKQACDQVLKAHNITLNYKIGTMIEIPRAALVAGRVAEEAEFFSFGTNDLTQMTLGLSRDDSGSFLPKYVEKGLFRQDPFVTLDQEGVGELVKIACARGRSARPDLKIGICGEHGGDTATIEFCHGLGFNYVSCSPFRVPVARLAAAQAALKAEPITEKVK
jgi:phosphoenolpyruvate synthase/pyruvate phosphate dikinase